MAGTWRGLSGPWVVLAENDCSQWRYLGHPPGDACLRVHVLDPRLGTSVRPTWLRPGRPLSATAERRAELMEIIRQVFPDPHVNPNAG